MGRALLSLSPHHSSPIFVEEEGRGGHGRKGLLPLLPLFFLPRFFPPRGETYSAGAALVKILSLATAAVLRYDGERKKKKKMGKREEGKLQRIFLPFGLPSLFRRDVRYEYDDEEETTGEIGRRKKKGEFKEDYFPPIPPAAAAWRKKKG